MNSPNRTFKAIAKLGLAVPLVASRVMNRCLIFTLSALVAVIVVPGASAALIASYDSGVTATAGASGAANPTTQGWTLNNPGGANNFKNPHDSGNGGWRTVDGTAVGPDFYSRTLSAGDVTELTTMPQWKITWTVAMDEDAIGSPSGFVDNYYLAPNNSRQADIYVWIDVDNAYSFRINHTLNGSNQLILDDDTGNSFNTGLTITSFPKFITLSLLYNNDSGVATLDYGAGTGAVSPVNSDPNLNRILFGATSTLDQGSAVWNELNLQAFVPEPRAYALAGIGLLGLGLLAWRRKRIADC